MPVKRFELPLGFVEPRARFKVPAVRVMRHPDSYVRLWLYVAKDHHGGNCEYRFQTRKCEKPKKKRGPSCEFYTAKICFLRVEDREVVGPELLLINGNIISSQIILVDALCPAITGENELLVQITASASSEAEGEALGADEKGTREPASTRF
jgi:hypothetical protein